MPKHRIIRTFWWGVLVISGYKRVSEHMIFPTKRFYSRFTTSNVLFVEGKFLEEEDRDFEKRAGRGFSGKD